MVDPSQSRGRTPYVPLGRPLPAPRLPPQVPAPRPRHLAADIGEGREGPIAPTGRPLPSVRHGWHWLLVIPGVMPLLTPVYNRIEPTLWGIPFFYWYQLACVVVACLVTTVVYQLTKGRR